MSFKQIVDGRTMDDAWRQAAQGGGQDTPGYLHPQRQLHPRGGKLPRVQDKPVHLSQKLRWAKNPVCERCVGWGDGGGGGHDSPGLLTWSIL